MQVTEKLVEYLKGYLSTKRMNLSDFSKLSGITVPTLSKMLNDKTIIGTGLQQKTINRICKVIFLTPAQLYQVSIGDNPYKAIPKVDKDPLEHFLSWLRFVATKEEQNKILTMAEIYGYKQSIQVPDVNHNISHP